MSSFRSNSKPTINLPKYIKGKHGILAIPVHSIEIDDYYKVTVLNIKNNNETVLCVQDEMKNIYDLSKIVNIFLQVKSGMADTDYGAIMFILFTFYDTTNPNDKFTYEVVLNPCDMNSLCQYGLLSSQSKWKVLVVWNNEILNTFEFDNIYNLESSLIQVKKASMRNRCTDFENAKKQYFKEYDIDTLLNS